MYVSCQINVGILTQPEILTYWIYDFYFAHEETEAQRE